MRSFGDDRIDYVRSDRNIGPEGNFRRVLELADTELLLILPDDDLLYPDLSEPRSRSSTASRPRALSTPHST